MGEFDPPSRKSVCLCKITQRSHFINEIQSKTDEKLSQNENFIHMSLCIGLIKKQKRIIFAARWSPPKRFEGIASQFSCRFIGPSGTVFLKHFAITVRNTKNRSIRKAFQYKSTIKPVIICVLNSEKRLKIPFEVRRSKVQSVRHAVFPLDKTTIWTQSTISPPLILRFPGLKLSSIP